MNYKNIEYMKKNALILLAGGSGKRFDKKIPKQFKQIGNSNFIDRILKNIISNKKIGIYIIVYKKGYLKETNKIISNYRNKNFKLIEGGNTRQSSSFKALKALKKFNPKKIIIHDACRPFINNDLINNIIKVLDKFDGCAPIIKNVDLARIKRNNKFIEYKSELYLTQTPQGFKYKKILKAHTNFKYIDSRDDIELINNENHKIKFINGNKNNIKITYKEDLNQFKIMNYKKIKYGIGYDIHSFDFSSKSKLKLCGLKINYFPLKGHSDADVGYHALCDSIFGALGIGDIGKIFKNTDKRWKNIDSKFFLEFAKNKIDDFNAEICNIDINFICEKPKISKYSNKMKSNIAKILNINEKQINIKATTNEKIGFIGKGNGIAAESIISISL